MNVSMSNTKIGVYVDVANMMRNGGYGMQYDVLRQFACRDGGQAIRLNAYVSYDRERGREDYGYREKTFNYFAVLREFGYKVIQKDMRWYEDEEGNRYSKANYDLHMAVDMLLQSENLDQVMLVTGDGDFTQVVRALQNKGCRVEVLAFENVSSELRREADMFINGHLIPNLVRGGGEPWGEIGSRVRGYCYHHDDNKGFGFMRYLAEASPGLWVTDTRNENSPYRTAFFHDSQLPEDFNVMDLPSRQIVFEFTLSDSGPDRDPGGVSITEIARF